MALKGGRTRLWCAWADCLLEFSLRVLEGRKVRRQTCCFHYLLPAGGDGSRELFLLGAHAKKKKKKTTMLFILFVRISPRICVIPACLDFYAQATLYFDFCMFLKAGMAHQFWWCFSPPRFTRHSREFHPHLPDYYDYYY